MQKSATWTFFIVGILFVLPWHCQAATLSLNPAGGIFEVGSTFQVSIILDSENRTINALEVNVQFPKDILQVISPTTGKSIISLWTSKPSFNNIDGTLNFQGVIPGGINVEKGLVATLTFRAKAPGEAFVKINDNSSVLLHDGLGTEVLHDTSGGIYDIVLPPPEGPAVASDTHPNQLVWYPLRTVSLRFEPIPDAAGYSYVLNKEPVDVPDDISEGTKNAVVYRDLADGKHFFHIKASRGDMWGGATHFGIQIDAEPPADFPISILPSARTASPRPILEFGTTDRHSGMEHYELSIVPLSPEAPDSMPVQIEAESPFIVPRLSLGSYDAFIYAYDRAGNVRVVKKKIEIVKPIYSFFDERGLYAGDVALPWWVLALIFLIIIIILSYIAWVVKRYRNKMEMRHLMRTIPSVTEAELDELNTYRKKYGKITAIMILTLSAFFGAAGDHVAYAATEDAGYEALEKIEEGSALLGPPIITIFSDAISNEEIFYTGGVAIDPRMTVIIYLQNNNTGEVISERITPDKKGRWFYRHHTFLQPGDYSLWTEGRLGEESSPPSAEKQLSVRETAVQIGASRVSYEFIYLLISVFLSLIIIALVSYIAVHGYHARKKHRAWLREIYEAEEAVREGFMLLRKDIETELALVHRIKMTKNLTEEERAHEKELLRDLDYVERRIGKEMSDIERMQD
ncbi:cohesin domain-containing protein [bacterium]|nr:cohesin domain-containing protein [bacterium]